MQAWSAAGAVALGGLLGCLARWAIGRWLAPGLPAGFPWATLGINVLGCLLLGLVLGAGPARVPEAWRLGLGTGFCGGFTTFSTFGVEAVQLLEAGAWGRAGAYVLASNLLGLLAATGGYFGSKAWHSG